MPGPDSLVDTATASPYRSRRLTLRGPRRRASPGRDRWSARGIRPRPGRFAWSPRRRDERVPDPAREGPAPALRDQTLARDRLLDWLAAKIHQRVVLVIADAGYGKTTLLADFSRRTRLRTLWYRLDDDDRDWISFLSHLVAAGREHDPAFAPTTSAMLSDLAMGGPTREAATEVFLRELPSIAEHGAVLILDDFHLVDESPDVRMIARELVARAPERLSIVFASRRTPTIPLARLRASGEVVELGTDDLRFDADRDGAAVLRDLRARARPGRPRRRRRADRRLGGIAPARPGRPARPIAGGDPAASSAA